MSQTTADELDLVQDLKKSYDTMRAQIANVVVGQIDVVDEVLVAVFCRGHALLVGAPGLAKTLLVSTIAKALDLTFKRVQFTPDLMPSDITGTDVLEEDQSTGKRVRRFLPGPIFANMVLADEINRTPPKTQASLLEAMQERHVTVGQSTYMLPDPFFVLATQNPIEQEGTYPLPEAQLDRFMFDIRVGYPKESEEIAIIKQVTGSESGVVNKVLSGEDVIRLQKIVKKVAVGDHVVDFAAKIARASRPNEPGAPEFAKELISWGAGPRAGINLISAAKAWAVLQGRVHATTKDVERMAIPVLRHRIIPAFHAEASGITREELIRRLIEHVKPNVKMDV